MAYFVKLSTTQTDGAPIYINLDLVTAIKSRNTSAGHYTVLECGHECSYVVAEDVDQLLKLLQRKSGAWVTGSD